MAPWWSTLATTVFLLIGATDRNKKAYKTKRNPSVHLLLLLHEHSFSVLNRVLNAVFSLV